MSLPFYQEEFYKFFLVFYFFFNMQQNLELKYSIILEEKNVKFTLEEDGSLLDTVVAEGAHGEISDDKLKDTEALFDKNDY